MNLSAILELIGAILFSLVGGAVIVFALSKWIGGIWAGRILENEKAKLTREHELLVRRRNVYTKLALTMRVFLNSNTPSTQEQKDEFIAAYDEAALWAAEEVAEELGEFMDMQVSYVKQPDSITQEKLQEGFVKCISSMRKDCGFPESEYSHRIVSF